MVSDIKELVEYVVKQIVDSPELVSVTEVPGERTLILELRVGQGDLGKVIGKEGRTAKALRTLVQAAASRKGKRAVLEILE